MGKVWGKIERFRHIIDLKEIFFVSLIKLNQIAIKINLINLFVSQKLKFTRQVIIVSK